MTSKKDKETFAKMCKCGHRLGQHSYTGSWRCLACLDDNKCKEFRQARKRNG